jgi:hypothetical protein
VIDYRQQEIQPRANRCQEKFCSWFLQKESWMEPICGRENIVILWEKTLYYRLSSANLWPAPAHTRRWSGLCEGSLIGEDGCRLG